MPTAELSDAEVFGGQSKELSDEQVFGKREMSEGDVFGASLPEQLQEFDKQYESINLLPKSEFQRIEKEGLPSVTSEEAEQILSEPPFHIPPAVKKQLPKIISPVTAWLPEPVQEGLGNVIGSVIESTPTPVGAGLIAATAVAPEVALLPAAAALKSGFGKLGEASVTKDPVLATEGAAESVLGALLVKPGLDPILDVTGKAATARTIRQDAIARAGMRPGPEDLATPEVLREKGKLGLTEAPTAEAPEGMFKAAPLSFEALSPKQFEIETTAGVQEALARYVLARQRRMELGQAGALDVSGETFSNVGDTPGFLQTAEQRLTAESTFKGEPTRFVDEITMDTPLRTVEELVRARLEQRDWAGAVADLGQLKAEVSSNLINKLIGPGKDAVPLKAGERLIFNEIWDKALEKAMEKPPTEEVQNAVQIESSNAEVLRPESAGTEQGVGLRGVGEEERLPQSSEAKPETPLEVTPPETEAKLTPQGEIGKQTMPNERYAEADAEEAARIAAKNQGTFDIITKLENLKVKGDYGKTSANPFPQIASSVWNTALDIAIAAVKAGHSIHSAISEAMQHIRRNAKGFDEEAVLNALATAAEREIKPPTRPALTVTPPPLPKANGSVAAPAKDSIFAADSPPGTDQWPWYGQKAKGVFQRWWEEKWPRTQKTIKEVPNSPVISEHQRLIEHELNFMENFSKEPWWKAMRAADEVTNVRLENQVVRRYRELLGDRETATPDQILNAWEKAVSEAPADFQAALRFFDERAAADTRAAHELGVSKPPETEDPYIPRLTKSDRDIYTLAGGKDTSIGGQLKSSIGAFAKSRSHATMMEGIQKGTQYEPMARAVWQRALVSAKLEATAELVRSLKGKVLFDTPEAAKAASPTGEISKLESVGGNDYWVRSREEGKFLEQNLRARPHNPLAKLGELSNAFLRNWNLINPLPHTTKNMFFKYALARVGNAKFKADVAEFKNTSKADLIKRFEAVMPMPKSGMRLPQLTAREAGTFGEKALGRVSSINDFSTRFTFGMADPAMRYSLWKSYIRKGMGDQEAANHVWLDLIRYDENSGAMQFWKNIPLNFFVPWRLGTYVSIAKQFRAHPIRSLLFIGAIDYLREMRYRKTGRWTHLPVDYLDAPLSEALQDPKTIPGIAATTLLFGPGGGQAPSSIKDLMSALHGDPENRARLINMFWGISQLYEMPREFKAYLKDGNEKHLINLLTSAALAEHSALKYEPRRLMHWLPDWMPGLQKSALVKEAESLQKIMQERREKGQATYEKRHGVSATFERTPEQQQMEELRRGSGKKRRSILQP